MLTLIWAVLSIFVTGIGLMMVWQYITSIFMFIVWAILLYFAGCTVVGFCMAAVESVQGKIKGREENNID